jgi:hypothetical protein
MLQARHPKDIADHAYLKLCKIDVKEETEKWARTGKLRTYGQLLTSAPKFTLDGRVAVVTIDTAFQSMQACCLYTDDSTSSHSDTMGWKLRSEEQEVDHGHGMCTDPSYGLRLINSVQIPATTQVQTRSHSPVE